MLSGEKVSDQGGVAVQVSIPFDPRSVWSWKLFASHLHLFRQIAKRRFVIYGVQIFVHHIQHEFQKLFCILLLVKLPSLVESPAYFLLCESA